MEQLSCSCSVVPCGDSSHSSKSTDRALFMVIQGIYFSGKGKITDAVTEAAGLIKGVAVATGRTVLTLTRFV